MSVFVFLMTWGRRCGQSEEEKSAVAHSRRATLLRFTFCASELRASRSGQFATYQQTVALVIGDANCVQCQEAVRPHFPSVRGRLERERDCGDRSRFHGPREMSGEAMLLQCELLLEIGSWAKLWPAERNPARNGLGAIGYRVGPRGEKLLGLVNIGGHTGAERINGAGRC